MKHFIFKLFVAIVFIVQSWMLAAADTTLPYNYDSNGNMISGEGKYFEYNDANQLVRVRQNNVIGLVVAEYFYDYNGQRVKKVEKGVTTYYIGKHYETQVADYGKTKTNTSYYFANGERVAKKDSTGTLFYYHSDHLGGTNDVTDASGNLVQRTKYYPFGEIREGGSDKYLYTSKEKDKQTDCYYYDARYYNSQLKHFTQADIASVKIYNPQELNRYSYVMNNPLKYIDISGNNAILSWFLGLFRINVALAPDSSPSNTIQKSQTLESSEPAVTKYNPPSPQQHYLYEDISAEQGLQCTAYASMITGYSLPLGYSDCTNCKGPPMDYYLDKRNARITSENSLNIDKGDILVLDMNKANGGRADHVAVVIGRDGNTLTLTESNVKTSKTNGKPIITERTIDINDPSIKGYYDASLKSSDKKN